MLPSGPNPTSAILFAIKMKVKVEAMLKTGITNRSRVTSGMTAWATVYVKMAVAKSRLSSVLRRVSSVDQELLARLPMNQTVTKRQISAIVFIR